MSRSVVMCGSPARWMLTVAMTVVGLALLPKSALATPAPTSTPAPTVVASVATGVGVVSVVPATGTDQQPLTLVTSGHCPAGGTNVFGVIVGPGLPDGIVVVPNSDVAVFPRTAGGGLYLPSNNSLRNLVDELPDPPVLKGTYQLKVECRGPSKIADLGDFYGSLVFDGHHAYKANEPNVPESSLATIEAPTGPPVPTAVGSQAPQSASSKSPAAVEARPASASTSTGSKSATYAPWLMALGGAIALAGLATVIHGRRGGKRAGSSG